MKNLEYTGRESTVAACCKLTDIITVSAVIKGHVGVLLKHGIVFREQIESHRAVDINVLDDSLTFDRCE